MRLSKIGGLGLAGGSGGAGGAWRVDAPTTLLIVFAVLLRLAVGLSSYSGAPTLADRKGSSRSRAAAGVQGARTVLPSATAALDASSLQLLITSTHPPPPPGAAPAQVWRL